MGAPLRIDKLIRKYFDRDATEAERLELDELLRDNPAAAEAFADAARMDGYLSAILKGESSLRRETAFIQQIDGERSKADFKRRQPSRRLRWLAAAGLAASVMLVVGLSVRTRNSGPDAEIRVARLRQVHDEVQIISGGNKTPARPEQEVFSGQGLQVVGENSSALVVYPDGTRLEVGADTTLTELSEGEAGKRIVLAKGNLTADVAKQPPDRPMLFVTPNAEVLVLGTRFDISGGPEGTFVETNEGAVQLTRKRDGQSIQVPVGFDALADTVAGPLITRPQPPRFDSPQLVLDGYWTVAFSPDGKTLAVTIHQGAEVELWDTITGRRLAVLSGHTQRVHAVAFSPDGRTLATGGRDRTVKLWDVATRELRATLEEQPNSVIGLAFFAEGRMLAVLSGELFESRKEKTLTLWDVNAVEQQGTAQTLLTSAWAFSPDGQTLAAATSRGSVMLRNLATGESQETSRTFVGVVFSLAFSQDGTLLAIYTVGSGSVPLWDLTTGQVRDTIRGFTTKVLSMAFSPDGAWLATGHRQDAVVRIWDVAGRREQLLLLDGRHRGYVRRVVFGPDSRTLATCEVLPLDARGERNRNVVKLWRLPDQFLDNKPQQR